MPVARHSSSRLPGSPERRSPTIEARSPLGLEVVAIAGVATVAGASVWGSETAGSESCGSAEGSSRSGTGTVGRSTASAGSTGLGDDPACAGAIVTALSAAQISNADRKEANMNAVKLAVSTLKERRITRDYFRNSPPGVPRLAWHPTAVLPKRCPPLVSCLEVSLG